MAVVVMNDLEGMTPEIYKGINSEIGFPETVPDGLLSHIAGPIDGGMRIIDVWETREDFERFIDSRLGPALGKVDTESAVSAPQPEEFPVHTRFPA